MRAITKIMKNQEDKLNKLFDNYVNSDTSLEFSEYVTRESLNDPDFFRWLFDDPDISDFGENLVVQTLDGYIYIINKKK